jgi:hypothetical protein
MTDYIWPSSLVPNASEWRLVSNTAAFASPLSGTTRTLGRGGDRWACSFTFNNLTDDSRAILQAFLAQLRGQTNRVYVRDDSFARRGSIASRNVLPSFSSSDWTATYVTKAVTGETARLTALAHTAGQYPLLSTSATVVNGASYVLRAFYDRTSTGTASVGPNLSDGVGSTALFSTAIGLKQVQMTSASTTMYSEIVIDTTASSMATGDYADVSYASLARCLRVYGASQTGSYLNVWATSGFTGALLPGDRIEYGSGEFNMVVAPCNDSSNLGRIYLARPIRNSPGDNTAVIVHDPLCRMMLADHTVGWSNIPGGFSSFTVDFIEDIA